MQARSRNAAAGPLQNIRSRYRLRLNVDMAGIIANHPFSIAEAYLDYHPNSRVSLRGGRMEEVFADDMRFLWDEDVRFNVFHQILKVPLRAGVAGFKSLEMRVGEYVLNNPNVAILSPCSPFSGAGFPSGAKVRAANLFHPGFILTGGLGRQWAQQLTGDAQLYHNANQLASLMAN